MRYTIGIDCPPGNPRPGDLIAEVIEGTGLPKRETTSRVFGAWVWDYSDVPGIADLWELHSDTIWQRLKALNDAGRIRGAQLTPPPAKAWKLASRFRKKGPH